MEMTAPTLVVPPLVAGAGPETDRRGKKIRKVFLPGQSPTGEPIFSLLLKRTYDIVPGGRAVRAGEDRKLFGADVHYGDPAASSVRFESEYIPYKLQTDVVFDGKAHAMGGVPVQSLPVAISLLGRRKEILVVGDRVCRGMDGGRIAATAPIPFVTMELKRELTYGGVDVWTDPKMPFAYPRNPLGKGFIVKHNPKSLYNLALPNLEDPADRISAERLCVQDLKNWEKQPVPAGLGWTSKYAPPRMNLLGTMPGDVALEKELREQYAELLQGKEKELYLNNTLPSMDFRYFNGAEPGLAFPYLQGDESISLENLTPDGQLDFSLPADKPIMRIDMGLGIMEPEPVLHTVQIHGELRQIDLVWRGSVTYPGPDWLTQMKTLAIGIA